MAKSKRITWHTEQWEIEKLKAYDKNPRVISAESLKVLRDSFDEIGMAQPVNINLDGTILSGHARKMQLEKEGERFVEVYVPDRQLTPKQEEAVIIRMNKNVAGEWDMEKLLEGFDSEDLLNWGFTSDEIDGLDKGDRYGEGGEAGALVSTFIIPPFSVLDTRQGYWRDRKAMWLQKTGNLSLTKEKTLAGGGDNLISRINEGSSNFDPVLAEIMMKWFCVPEGHIIDPFGGEQTKGVVAGTLGYKYSAVELRKDQVDINIQATQDFKHVKYVHGDSNNINKLLPEVDYDFCFTSPPYYDLEVYSTGDMSSLGTYAEFMEQYETIFSHCYGMLREDSFLAIKVGEIRDKKSGEYRNFVGDNIAMFRRIGFKYYNEFTLISPAGTGMLRAARYMNGGRKIIKLHQNVLVFYKGNILNIKTKFPKLEKPTVGTDDSGEE